MKKLTFLLLALFSIMPLAFSEEKEVVAVGQNGNKNGHNEGTTPPVVTFDDETGILEVNVDATQVSVTVTVENAEGEPEVESVAFAPGASYPLPLDGTAGYTVTLETLAGDVYEGSITL